MSRQKEKKIRRLHRKRIWPSMLTLFLFILAIVVIVVLMFGFAIGNVAKNKLESAIEDVQRVAEIINEENVESSEELKKLVTQLQRTLPNVQEVCIQNEEQENLMKSGLLEPEMNNKLELTGITDYTIYLLEESDNTLYAENGEIKFNTTKINDTFLSQVD